MGIWKKYMSVFAYFPFSSSCKSPIKSFQTLITIKNPFTAKYSQKEFCCPRLRRVRMAEPSYPAGGIEGVGLS